MDIQSLWPNRRFGDAPFGPNMSTPQTAYNQLGRYQYGMANAGHGGLEDRFNVMGDVMRRGDANVEELTRMVNDYRSTGRTFDPREYQARGMQQVSLANAQMPGVRSALKGMGVGAAEGTMALGAGMDAMGRKNAVSMDAYTQGHQAEQDYINNLINLVLQRQAANERVGAAGWAMSGDFVEE